MMCSIPAPAFADAESEAQTLFANGRQARDGGDCKGAIVHFARALEVYPQGLGSLRNIAECQEQLGQFATARRSYWDLRRAALRTSESKYEGWAEWAEQAHKRLEGQVSRLTIEIVGKHDSRALEVVIDGKPLDPRLLGVALERDPGVTEISLNYGGAAPIVRRVELAAGESEKVSLRLPDKLPGPPPPIVIHEDGSSWQTAGIVSLVIAGASLAAMFVSVGIREGAIGALEEDCPAYETEPCPSSAQGAVDRGEAASALVNVFAVVAGVGAGAGVSFLLMSGGDEPAKPTPPTPSPKGALLTIRGTF